MREKIVKQPRKMFFYCTILIDCFKSNTFVHSFVMISIIWIILDVRYFSSALSFAILHYIYKLS